MTVFSHAKPTTDQPADATLFHPFFPMTTDLIRDGLEWANKFCVAPGTEHRVEAALVEERLRSLAICARGELKVTLPGSFSRLLMRSMSGDNAYIMAENIITALEALDRVVVRETTLLELAELEVTKLSPAAI